jgi:drug/metabolite transporter (DMT)-like permease
MQNRSTSISHLREAALPADSAGKDGRSLAESEAAPAPGKSPLQVSLLRIGRRPGILLALLAVYIIWGSTYLGMRLALSGFPPFLMGGVRFLSAGALLYGFLRLRGRPRPTLHQWLAGAGSGVLMLVGSNGLVAFSEQWVATGLAAIALAAVPLWASLFAGLTGRWPRRLEWLGLVLGFAGVLLLNLEHGLRANPQGAIALLIAPICWSLGSIWSSRLPLASGLMSTAVQMLAGGTGQLLVGLLLGERITRLPGIGADLAMLYLIGAGSLLGYTAYGYLLRRVRPALATSYAYVNPLVAVFLGAMLAGEQVSPLELLAMSIILGSVVLISLQPRPAPAGGSASAQSQSEPQQVSE